MGVVYQARDPYIGRLVALKTITSGLSGGDSDQSQRFQREAQAAGSLQHPNIVTIYEMGSEDGVPYLVMEYLDGEGLDRVIARSAPVPFLEKFSYIVQLCHALQHAHENGIVHRDVKPANIVVKRDGTIRVVDFGIARLVDTTRTQTGVILGTIGYMSPQQLHGERASEQSDIWATGVLAYELLAGKKPFAGENHGALILAILSQTPEPLSNFVAACPAELLAVLDRAMHKDESHRYQSMRAMLAELEPVWKAAQQHGVNDLMDHAQSLLEKEDYSGVRKQLDQVLRIDRESATAAILLEELRCSAKGAVLREEVLSLIERGRQRLREGLFSDARTAAGEALRLDPQSKTARELLSEAEQMESAAQNALQEAAEDVSVLEREYAVQASPTAVAGRSSRAQTQPATATVKAETSALPRSASEGRSSSATVVLPKSRPVSRRRNHLWAAGFAVVAAIVPVVLYLRYSRSVQPAPVVKPTAITTGSAGPTAGSVEDRQRALMEQAHEAADQNDYSSARTRLDEAAKLGGSLTPRIEDLRRRFAEEEQNAGLRAVARQESDLWLQAQSAMQHAHFDDADKNFRSILDLPEGGRRREDAQRFLREVIPQRREEESLFAKLKANPWRDDSSGLQQEATLLDRIVSLDGPHRAEARQIRQQIGERLAAINSKQPSMTVSASANPASTPPDTAKPNPSEVVAPKPIPSQPAESPDTVAFQKAVEHFEKASQSRDLGALKKEVPTEFERIAQDGGPKAADAQHYLRTEIPMAIRDATPWPAIGCPAAPTGLAMTIKPGDTVACGFLDSPRLKWTQFTWPEWAATSGASTQPGPIAMLSLTVDESGNVIDVRPRGKSDGSSFLTAAISAARRWKTTPPRAQGKPVKTEFAVDLRLTP